MPHLHANGLRFHVQVLGHANGNTNGNTNGHAEPRPKVVMLHGLVADNLSSYYYTIANPLGLVADTYLYDLRGHGRTQVPKSGYAVVDHVADLRALLAAWSIDGPVHLVGNSFGGVVALQFAHLFPEQVASLVLIEAHFATEGWGEHMAGSLALAAFGLDKQGVKDWIERNASRKVSRLARHSEHLFLDTTLIDDLQGEQPFPHRSLAAIESPTLAIYGEGSDILDRAYDLQQHLPRCELHVVPGCSHSVLFEATPFVREHAIDWVTRHTNPADHPTTTSRPPTNGHSPAEGTDQTNGPDQVDLAEGLELADRANGPDLARPANGQERSGRFERAGGSEVAADFVRATGRPAASAGSAGPTGPTASAGPAGRTAEV